MLKKIAVIALMLIAAALPSFAEKEISFIQAPGQPYLVSGQIMIDAEEYNTLVLRLDSKTKGTAGVFWANNYQPQFIPAMSLRFYVKPGERNYYFNIPSQNPNWVGWTKGFLIYSDKSAEIKVRSAVITRGNLFTNIASGWQEFWGPKGREVIGSTINLTPASTVFSHPINVYIYWLTGIFFLAVLAWQRNFYIAGKWTIYFALGAWVLLGLNTYTNYYNIFKDDHGKYSNKSIEEKRSIAYGKDYYDFLVFAKENLPEEPVKFGVVSGRYAPDLQARIFLVPHVLIDPASSEADYLLVFDPDPKQPDLAKNFGPHADLNANAYILKRIK